MVHSQVVSKPKVHTAWQDEWFSGIVDNWHSNTQLQSKPQAGKTSPKYAAVQRILALFCPDPYVQQKVCHAALPSLAYENVSVLPLVFVHWALQSIGIHPKKSIGISQIDNTNEELHFLRKSKNHSEVLCIAISSKQNLSVFFLKWDEFFCGDAFKQVMDIIVHTFFGPFVTLRLPPLVLSLLKEIFIKIKLIRSNTMVQIILVFHFCLTIK